MKMSTKARYGIYAVVELSKRDSNQLVSVSELAQSIGVTEKYLEQILSLLKKADILNAVRGATGGYRLKCSPEKITVGAVLRALEDDLKIVDCLQKKCISSEKCVSHTLWCKLYENINSYLDSITLQQLTEEDL